LGLHDFAFLMYVRRMPGLTVGQGTKALTERLFHNHHPLR
jgi:hypothetical protein